jgi:hypothetical protein
MLWYVRHIDVTVVIVSKHYQHYVLRITTLRTICLMCHNTNNTMSCVSQRCGTQDIVLLVLCHIRNSVVSLVIRKTCCCHCCDTKNILLSVFVVMHKTFCSICHTDNNMSYLSQHWQQYVLHITTLTPIFLTYHNIDKTYCCQCYDA